MMKRSGKFYRKNEAEVMRDLGLKPTINSGSGPIEKEDGQSEHLICQLKSTDAQSIRLHKKDFDTLLYNAAVAHKLPIFAIQFLQSNEVYLLMKPDMVQDIARYLETGEYKSAGEFLGLDIGDSDMTTRRRVIKSSASARESFKKENERKFKKERKSAK